MPRKLPQLGPENRIFWTSGADGLLRLCHCRGCDRLVHPPSPICPRCLGRDMDHRAVSGRGRILSFTVNHHPWTPELKVPYVVAIVEIVEQPGIRLLTNIVDCPIERLHIEMPVRVVFENIEDVWLPLFVADTDV